MLPLAAAASETKLRDKLVDVQVAIFSDAGSIPAASKTLKMRKSKIV